MVPGFDIYETSLTNEELHIIYTPTLTTKAYSYKVFKDGEEYNVSSVASNEASEIVLSESGIYQISVTEIGRYNQKTEISSGTYEIDMESPVIACSETVIKTYKTADLETMEQNVLEYCNVTDSRDGDITNNLTMDLSDFSVGLHELTLTVSDEAGNTSSKNIYLNIAKDNSSLLLGFQILLGIILIALICQLIRYKRSVSFEKRLTKYSVQAIYDRGVSVFDSFMGHYLTLIKKISRLLNKSVFLKKYSKRYEKYIPPYKETYKEEMNFVAVKTLVAIFLVIIAVFAKTIQFQVLHLYEIFLPFIFGFMLPDIVYILKYKVYRNQIENDLLQAIIIMNNAFKSGRSITQAIELVTKELEGPIAEEFKKMHLELSFGLAIDIVFKRFASRIELEEVTYLTASLSILNRTGGNIIQVFTSIEKTLFNKKKLRLELASLTGSSKIIVYMLIAIPILFVVLISMISPTYFTPMYTTPIGFVFTGIIVIIYMLYIICVRKIMKVRM